VQVSEPRDDASSWPPPHLLDPQRLAAVEATGLLDSDRWDPGLLDAAAAQSWDRLTGLAARLLRAPMAFLTLVDDKQSNWLSCVGVEEAAGWSNPVEESFCQYVIADRAPFVVGDAAAHPRTQGNLSVEVLGVRAWAGFPVLDSGGQPLGSFCVLDTVPRKWTTEDIEVLGVLAEAAAAQVRLLTAVAAEREAEERLQRLTGVALELVGAATLDDLTDIVVNRALPVLGADGGAVIVVEADQTMRLAISARLGEQTQVLYGLLPGDSPLPACHVARTGERVQLPTRASGLAFTPEMEQVYETTQRSAWAFTPLTVAGRRIGSLAVSWREERVFGVEELELVDAFAAQCAQALDRIQAEEARRTAALEVQRLAESLQQALLTPPPQPDHLHIVVRYLPASHEAQVGGDWYDAFLQPDGATMLVIGDVVGHDRAAAAQMGQLRGLLRALAYTAEVTTPDDTPAQVLSRVEHAAAGLDVQTLATVVLARVERVPDVPVSGRRTLRWSNAGHLPPVLLLADGTSRLLEGEEDLLLGVDPDTARTDHTVELPDESMLLMFTDGLVERRGASLDEGLARLQAALVDLAGVGLDELCDTLLARLAGDAGEDDVALIAVRVHSEDAPRPPQAGPNRLPHGLS
jgi:serine phosphatase RsbU (regulator of sigma subunit)